MQGMFKGAGLFIGAAFIALLAGCGSGNVETLPDTREEGTIHISADESFKPVIDAQVAVYEASYPKTKINVHYKPEAECLKDFGVDSIRMVIATRGFTPAEEAFIADSFKIAARQQSLAYDAIAVLVHPSSADSLFTMQELRELLNGSNKKLTPVFDGLKATSTVRYIMDSVLRGEQLSPSVVAARTSEEVVDYVARTPKAIGFVGVSWVGNSQDSLQLSFMQKVKIASIESRDVAGAYIQPVQANIYLGRYPMIRPLVYTLKERHRGLGNGFAAFMAGQRGQLVFRRAYLVPAQLRLNVRPTSLREE
ncbi:MULTISPECIES: PstS family phosphate ABC transporter substrate-binding protein [Chitinophagaceae]|uniref:PstS family phosphate ABC transporter substrate-binding protein n=1 Tax=Chitinophagaceae TaxID=563835 RepID=UPI001F028924|nr:MULTISPECIES: substrate-binding domain-containing protein [Chitinophagaceae]